VATGYGLWLCYAAKLNDLLLATLLFAPATVIYMLARRERGERMFTRTETVVALVITAVGAYAFWARLTGRLMP